MKSPMAIMRDRVRFRETVGLCNSDIQRLNRQPHDRPTDSRADSDGTAGS